MIHKNKQRLTKMHQYLVRMRRMRLKARPTIERVHKKVDVREKRREIKAEKAALIDKSIEKELLTRLKAGTYGDIYNFPMKEYEAALDGVIDEEEKEAEEGGFVAMDSDDEEEDGEEDDEVGEDEAEWEADGEGFDEMAEQDGEEGEEGDEEDEEDDDDENEDGEGEEGDAGSESSSRPTGAGGQRVWAGSSGAKAATKPSSGAGAARAAVPSTKRGATPGKAGDAKRRKRREVEYEEERELAPRQTIDDW